MAFQISVRNYRGLAHADWSLLPGVSLLVGPNGSGKTTLLDVPALLRDAQKVGPVAAVSLHGGPGTLVNLRAANVTYAEIEAKTDAFHWQFKLHPHGGSIRAESAQSVEPGDWLDPIRGYRCYGEYWIRELRLNGSKVASADKELNVDGTNLFTVLRNWRDTRATLPRWNFVMRGLREAFPDLFGEIEFESAGQTLAASYVPPWMSAGQSMGMYFAPDGLFVGLLHLTAVASALDGGIVAIDEFENALHPFAIRSLLNHIREWATERDISVTLATHSPVLIDCFKDEPSRLLVMDPKAEMVPVRLDEMRNPEWLSHFSLGDLYAHGDFGSQAAS